MTIFTHLIDLKLKREKRKEKNLLFFNRYEFEFIDLYHTGNERTKFCLSLFSSIKLVKIINDQYQRKLISFFFVFCLFSEDDK